MKYAFRCNHCGHLEHGEHAGENRLPHACRVCGYGVRFDMRSGVKTPEPENWEVLANAKPERLAELGLEADHVEKWVPCSSGVKREGPPQNIRVSAEDGPGTKDSMS